MESKSAQLLDRYLGKREQYIIDPPLLVALLDLAYSQGKVDATNEAREAIAKEFAAK